MDSKIQTAYNEWLLKYGYREVQDGVLNKSLYCLFRNYIHLHTRPDGIYYQLKTQEEIKND